ncbi:MAG: SDR family oxidoreductase [Xanthomonadales bacterium]|nr:SDR family oxidoreductase [Xanthomonadales bacterium]
MTTRRRFIQLTSASMLGLGLHGLSAADSHAGKSGGLNILILGGTGFIGPHMVRRARERGHTVTLFNRGRTNTDLFPDVETLVGDRDSQLQALEGRKWDAVIDNSGYVPRHVRESAGLLSEAARQYLFISSISAYGNFEQPGIDEDYVLGTMEDESVEQVTGATYGPMKALCEKAAEEAFPGRATIVRPGYIVGPRDSTDRWTYWPLRVARGGTVVVPGTPDDPVQFIDARDLAAFTIHALENNITGRFNAVGPGEPMTMGAMLDAMKEITESDAGFQWVPAETLTEKNAFFPIWASPEGDTTGVHLVSNKAAVAAGMTFRPLAETVKDTLAWWDGLETERQSAMRSGLRVLDGPPEGMRPAPVSLEQQMEMEAKLVEELWSSPAEG